jgi:hypothetical protein
VPDLTRAAGRLVAGPLGAIARLRGGKPMHPHGTVFDAVLERTPDPRWTVPWLAAAGSEPAVVRLSRGAGLPAALPDLLGVAVRLRSDGEPVDLLLTTTGRGPLTRLLPAPRRDAAAFHSSIMGYRSADGAVRFAAVGEDVGAPSDPDRQARAVDRSGLRYTLLVARGLGPWRRFGRLALTAPVPERDPDVRFDAVQHPPPGLVPDGPMARFRAPAYARARAARS